MIARLICWCALLCLLPAALHAQSTEADIKARLTHKPLYLRGCWRDSKLHFDSTGHIKHNSSPVGFTLSGFELESIHLNPKRLILEGRRIGLELADNKQLRVPINGGNESHFKEVPIHIDIEAGPDDNYGPALDAIFVDDLADFNPTLPFYWKNYADKYFAPPNASTDFPTEPKQSSPSPDAKPHRIGGGVKPPKLLRAPEPTFNEVARRLRYGGNVLIYLCIQPDGTATNLSIIRALGMGLDESALAAVQRYKFAPATENGKPVLVELNIEVNFQIF